MASAAKIVKMPEARNATPIRAISPAMKSWIRNCIVPTLVREYLAEKKANVPVEGAACKVVKSDSYAATPRRVGR